MDDRYECATCCYATTSYQKFLEHGKEHAPTAYSKKQNEGDLIKKLKQLSKTWRKYSNSYDNGLLLELCADELDAIIDNV